MVSVGEGGVYELLFRPDLYANEYNCSQYSVDQIPLPQRRHILIGIAYMAIGIFCEVIYVPCMIAIRKHMDMTCYNFMFYIAFADMACLLMNAIVTGYLACVGAVFCSSSTFIYLVGAFGLALWTCETVAEMMLAFNRCVELCSSRWAAILFGGKRVYLWMIFPTLYGLYFFLFTRAFFFSAIYSSWFFNPHVGYLEDTQGIYHNHFHSLHNFIVISVLTSVYSTFAVILYVKSREANESNGNAAHSNHRQKMVFFQVVLISSINAVAASIYVYMQFVRINEVLIVLGQFAWIMAHGVPPLIYLGMNRTVRRDVFDMFARPLSVLLCGLVKVSPAQSQPSNRLFKIVNPNTAEKARVTPSHILPAATFPH